MGNVLTMREPQKQAGSAFGPASHPARKKSASAMEISRRNHAMEEQLDGLRRDHDELRRTMFEAAQVQRRLCGPRHLRRESFEIAAEIFPVRHLSGDFVGVFDFGDDLVFAIGDIAGKGLATAMWFTLLVATLQRHVYGQDDPGKTLQAVNRDLCTSQISPPLTTLFLGRLDLRSGEVAYCNAGHPPTLLLREDGSVDMLHQGGPLLGAVPGAAFTTGRCFLNSGDTLLGYSDGILESRNPQGEEFGTEGLVGATRHVMHSSANAALFSVLAATEDFCGDHPREDDMALVVVHRT